MLDTVALPLSIDAAKPVLVLRIRGTRRDGQTVSLRSPKCTIGSAPDCTLRVVARGVRPVHCLILSGRQGTFVRRWSGDTRLNGEAFVDAPLKSGDRLSIGPIQFEVVQCNAMETPALAPRFAALPRPVQEPAGRPSLSNHEVTQSRARDLAARRRCRELIAGLRAARGKIASLEREQCEQVRSRQDEQQTRVQQFAALQTQLESQKAAMQAKALQLDAALRELEGRESAMQAQVEALRAAQAELDARQAAFEAQRQQWEAEKILAQKPMRPESSRELEPDPAMLAALKPDRRFMPPQRIETSLETTQLFQRMGIQVPEDEPEHEPDLTPKQEKTIATSPSTPGETNESIDDYMAQLLGRLRARESASQASPAEAEKPKQAEPAIAATAAAPVAVSARPREIASDPAEVMPKPQTPQRSVNLEAMRELANFSAQAAIDSHSRGKLRSLRRSKLLLTLSALTCSLLLMGIWAWRGGDVNLLVGAIGFLVAVLWGTQYAVLSGRLSVDKSGHLAWQASGQSLEEDESTDSDVPPSADEARSS